MNVRAFTLIELMVVVAVILVLVGMGIPAGSALISRSRTNATRQVVMAVSAAAARQPRATLVCGLGAAAVAREAFDFNRDGILDGRPDLDPGFDAGLRADAQAVAYEGAIATARVSLQRTQLDAALRPVDAWKRPLRVGIASGVYGAGWIGVWSDGPDGVSGTADDIRSW